jgi:hypothetical protein
MQTFLPYPDFKKSIKALDYRRLGKQRVEAYQIIRTLKAAAQSKVCSGGTKETTPHARGRHPAYSPTRGPVPPVDDQLILRGADAPDIRRSRSSDKSRRMIAKRLGGWIHHPAVRLWRHHVNSLKLYHNLCIDEWVRRGYKNKMNKMKITGKISYPPWFGRKDFHAAHRSNLLRKDQTFYGQYGWKEPPDLPYLWE